MKSEAYAMIYNMSKMTKDIIKNIALLGALEVVLGAVLIIIAFDASFALWYIFGIIYGSVIAMFRIIHIEKSMNASLELVDKLAASNYFKGKYFIRTVVTAGALVLAFWFSPIIGTAAVAIGLLNSPIAVHLYKFKNKNTNG